MSQKSRYTEENELYQNDIQYSVPPLKPRMLQYCWHTFFCLSARVAH